MRVLALRVKVNQTSPMVSLSITGKRNPEADFASRIFRDSQGRRLTLTRFVSLFNCTFKPKTPYTGVRLSPKIVSRLISEMQNKPSRIESWLRVPKNDSSTGRYGCNTAESQTLTRVSEQSRNLSSPFLRDSRRGCVEDLTDEANESNLRRFVSRFRPSARPLHWKDSA